MQKSNSNNLFLTNRSPARLSNRRGIATLWVILSLPVLLTLLVVMIDVANIWLAKVELRNATDAAALSGVKSWGEGFSTAQSRVDANDAFSTNTILGNTSALNTAEGGCTNGNVISTGELLFGSTTDTGGVITFNCNGSPACVAGAITASLQANTIANPTQDTQTNRLSFQVNGFTGPAGATLNSVTIDLSTMVVDEGGGNVADNGFFDFNVQGAPADNQSGADFAPAGANEAVILGGTFLSSTNGGATVGSTNAVLNATQTSLTVTFNAFDPADTVIFAVDTDRVGPDNGNNGDDVADFGGHFGSGHNGGANLDTITGATVTFVISGQSFTGTLVADNVNNNDVSTVSIVDVLNGGDAFGVRARKTVQISSVVDNFCGVTFGPYNITTESFARFQCNNGPPQLMHVDSFFCTCP
jgi:Flp pilus assembly protein TadG